MRKKTRSPFATPRSASTRAKWLDSRRISSNVYCSTAPPALSQTMATFDGFGFSMFTGLFFLLFGMAAALWRITVADWRERNHDELSRAAAARPGGRVADA